MNTKISLLALSLLTTGCVKTHWGYTGHAAPEYWGSLDPKYSTCDKGVNQSPINLTGFIESDLSPLAMTYSSNGSEVINKGYTIQVNFQPGSYLSLNDRQYELKQFHFHSPSENHINGMSYPLEVHLVHADANGNLAVVGVMFEEGIENSLLNPIWKQIPAKAKEKTSMPLSISATELLPENQEYYRYNGSLTTPPCSEGVLWLVMKQPITASKQQIEQFNAVMQKPTNRPVQPVNARPVLK